MFNLLPKDTVFFDLFEKIAQHVVASAKHLQRLAREFPRVDASIQLIRNEEHEADNLAHTALDRLDRTFITPFDREDIHGLIGELDDIVDAIDALGKRFPLFHVKEMDPYFVKQTDVLVAATEAVREAVHRIRKSRKLSELSDKLIEIHHHESVGDDNHHAAMHSLFSGKTDALEVMKWKELFDYIENAIDGCEDVGNTLERIVLKNG
jgi:predicted phosphate transport protein (TIGR00153 family)